MQAAAGVSLGAVDRVAEAMAAAMEEAPGADSVAAGLAVVGLAAG